MSIITDKNNSSNSGYYVVKYSNCKRILSVLYSCFQIIICVVAIFFLPWYIAILFICLLPIVIYFALEMLFFQALIINKTHITRKSYLFKIKKFDIKNLKVETRKRLFTGMIRFKQKGKMPIYLDVFPIGTIGWLRIRQILSRKNIIDKNNDGWSN